MGRPLRRHEPNVFYLVTTRCHQARFLLRPDPAVNQAVLEWLTRAQRLYPDVQLFGICVMSDHLHLLVRDTQAELAAWASYFFGNVARAVNAIRNRSGVVFERRYAAEPILDDAALLDRLAYLVTNPAKAGLCDRSRDWPGLVLWARTGQAESHDVFWVDRNAYRLARYRARHRREPPPSPNRYRERGTLVIHPLVTESESESEEPGEVAELIALREHEFAAERNRSRKPAMTRPEVLSQDWHAAPRRPKRSPRPICHTSERRLRERFLEALREFVSAFREASAQWRSGIHDTPFPLWSYPPGGVLVRSALPAPA